MPNRALILIDGSNLKYFCHESGLWIDWSRFQSYFQGQYREVKIIYYEGFRSKASFFDYKPEATFADFIEAGKKKLEFFTNLECLGIKVIKKPVSRVYDATEGKYKHKCNFDVEMTIDAIDQIPFYDECIICSGDGDFVKLLRYLKGHRKRVTVLAPKTRLCFGLKKAANRTIFLEQIKSQIEDRPGGVVE